MDLKARHQHSPLDTHTAFLYAESLFQRGDFRTLEAFFRSALSTTLDLNIWSLYLKYVAVQNPTSTLDAYSHMLSAMWFHYDIYDYVVEYIRLLDQDVDKIRETYARALSNPIHNLSALFQQYEAWELSLSRATYKTLVSERLPAYQNCFKLYQKLLPFISSLEFDNIFRILDLESPSRKPVVARYFRERFYYREEIYFLHNEISPDRDALREGIRNTDSMLLRMYFSVYYDDTEVLCLENDLETICYLNILGKRGVVFFHEALASLGIRERPDEEMSPEGLEAPKQTQVGPHVLVYAARLEYALTSDAKAAFAIFYSGINQAPSLNEAFLRFLIDINDVENSKAVFKIAERTEKMWEWMLDLEFKYGSFSEYKRLATEMAERKGEAQKRPGGRRGAGKAGYTGYQFLYESLVDSFSFLDLRIPRDALLEDFIKVMPKLSEDSVFRCLKSAEVISLLKKINFLG